MHETERHRVILAAVQARPLATVADLVDITGTSEATIRRDIAALHVQGRLRRVRGGAEAINPPEQGWLMGRPFSVNETINIAQKRAIAREAVKLCRDGEAIVLATVSPGSVAQSRVLGERNDVLGDRRPDVYG